MRFADRYVLHVPLVCTVLFAGAPAARADAAEWKPVAREELTLPGPIVDKEADAEALFWDVRIRDEMSGGTPQTVYEQYLRIKVFTDRGRELNATVDIPYTSGIHVSEIAARTLKRDGRIIELNRRDIHERTIVKMSGLKLKAFSFAVPSLERGDIVEYRWKEVYTDSLAQYLRLPFWREIPSVEVNYYVRPLDIPGFSMRWQGFNAKFSDPQRQRDGSTLVSLAHVPAYADAPFSPPEHAVKPWIFIYYDDSDEPKTTSQFWKRLSKELEARHGKEVRVDDDIRAAATSAVANLQGDDEKLAALVDLLRARVKRVDVDTATDAERRMAKENRHSGDTLKRGYGTAADVTALFVALARSAGFDARIAAVPRRDDIFFGDRYLNSYFMAGRVVAVKQGEGWRFVEPANRYGLGGMLRWHHEWQPVVIPDKDLPVVAETPMLPAVNSVKRRTATLQLLEDGTLEGEMSWTFTGHWGQTFKEQEDAETPADRERTLKDTLLARLPGAEITDVRIENVTDPKQSYKNSWRVRMPGFAQRTGTRLFVAPAVFQRGIPPTLSASSRSDDIYFRFPWAEDDIVTIDLPPGFMLEAPQRPAPLDAGFAAYSVTLGTNESGRRLVFRRRLTVGQKNMVLFSKDHYAAIKGFFDAVHQNDSQTLALRRQESSAQ